ncbi:MAG: MFS transporter, partial [Promethearchaeota archaeon]
MPLSKKFYKHQNKNLVSNYSTENYRVWPLFMLSFIRLFYVSIFERALQNYLYRVILISESTLGIISSAGSIAYIFAPILGQFITSKLGIRNALILSCVITPILTGAQIMYFEPWFLIMCRVLLGISLGVFWPNCFNLLSKWQKVSNLEKSNKNFKHFNFSWNSGFLLGLLVGYVWAFVWNDYFAMIASWVMSFLL